MPELMYDEFKVVNKVLINNDDINSLTKLYLPLMGIDSYTLYLGLSTLSEGVSYNFKYLLDTLNLRSLKNINSAQNKLEGIGLLNVYINKDKNYLFELKRPMAILAFMKEECLKSLLVSEIGENEVNKLIENEIKIFSGYKNITKAFSDVYDTTTKDKLEIIEKLVKHDIVIDNKDFNYTLFKYLFDTSFISNEVLDDSDFKANILRISFTYKLDETQMKDVVIASLDSDKNLDYASLSKNAKIAYQRINKTSEPRIITKEDDEYLDSVKDDQTISLCHWLENMSPSEVLESMSGIKASASELKMIDDLINNTKFPISVINFMICMVIKEKDGVLPGYSYFEKIANTWARAKVKNVNDVLNFIKKHNDAKDKEGKASKGKTSQTLPAWYDEYNKELNKKLEDNKELKTEEVKEILESANSLFGE